MFPTDSEKKRAQRIEENYKLFCGKFGDVLKYFKDSREKRDSVEVVQNVAGLVSRVFADLMFLKDPIITMPSDDLQEKANEIIHENQLMQQFLDAAISQSYAGRATFKMRIEDGIVKIEEINPSIVFPQYDPMSIRKNPDTVILSWIAELDSTLYRYKETHTVGLIEYAAEVVDTDGNSIGAAPLSIFSASLPDSERTELEHIPIYWCDNLKTGREIHGFSDYDDLRHIFTELTRVQSQIATQIKKHGDAKMAVPAGVLNEHGDVDRENIEMIEISNTDEGGGLVVPQYITNSNPLIEAAFKEQERLLEALARTAEVSSTLIDLNVSGGVEKVGALRLRMLRTLAKVERKLKSFDHCIKEMLSDAIAWQFGDKVEPKDIRIKFRNGLPQDELEMAQIESMRLAAGNQTISDSVRNLDNIDGKYLSEKVALIRKEEEAARELVGQSQPSIAF